MQKYTLNLKGDLVTFDQPVVMGILNLTEDSFYDGGRYDSVAKVLNQTEKMIAEGATFIDVGAASTRPGSPLIKSEEEIGKLTPILEELIKKFPETYFSIDTYNSKTAEFVVKNYGFAIVNDISGGQIDSEMFVTVSRLGVPYVIMHMQGTPESMQQNTTYKNLLKDILFYFSERIQKARLAGICDIIIDPGFGFGKTTEQNFELLQHSDQLHITECPVLVGLSRKSMIYKTLETTPDHALNGTTALNMIALTKGALILRVHDVHEAIETIKLYKNMKI
jgi:dihydropteroate synthase